MLGVASGYPALRPTLLLDFANSRAVDPRITFTRSSTATRVNKFGLIESVASGVPRIDFDPVTLACNGLLIEEARTNLLTYSEQFDNAAWVKSASSVSENVALAPDGTTTADKLVDTAANAAHSIRQLVSSTSGVAHTFTTYVKAGELTQCALEIFTGTSVYKAVFNISTGAFVSSAGAGSYTISSSGSGWFRVSITATSTSATVNGFIYPAKMGVTTYTGDGTSGIYIWGAQLEAGSFPTSYIPSSVTFTGRASAGSYFGSDGLLKTAASGEARMNYNPLNLTVAPKLLLEEQRTNLLRYSGDRLNAAWASSFINGSGSNFWTVTASTEVGTPGDVGTVHKYVATSTTQSLFARQNMTFDAGKSYVASLWVYVPVSAGVNNFMCNVNFGDIENANSLATSEFGKWVRLSSVIPALAATRSWVDFELFLNAGSVPSSGFTFYATAFQLEEIPAGSGSYPTSYIKTEAAQVTRAADTSTSAQTTRTADVAVMTGTNFSSWYRQDEGTFTAEFDCLTSNPTAYWRALSVNDGAAGNETALLLNAISDKAYASVTSGGVSVFNTGGTANGNVAVSANTTIRASLAYKPNDFACSMNGGTVQVGSSGNLPVGVYQLRIGNLNGGDQLNSTIRRIAFFPKRLANAELQAITA